MLTARQEERRAGKESLFSSPCPVLSNDSICSFQCEASVWSPVSAISVPTPATSIAPQHSLNQILEARYQFKNICPEVNLPHSTPSPLAPEALYKFNFLCRLLFLSSSHHLLLQTSCFNVADGFSLLCTRCINKGLFAQNEAKLSSLIRLFGSGSADNYRVVFPPLCIFNMLQSPYACGISCLFAWVSSEVNFSREQCGRERKAANFPDTEEQRMYAAGRIQLLRNILDTIKLKA